MTMAYKAPNHLYYRITQLAADIAAAVIFRRRVEINELRGKKGPFLVIANHECAWDFVNLIGLSGEYMRFVIGSCMYNTLPIRGWMKKIGVLPKQQFQTRISDMKEMKRIVDSGEALVIYPAGLMCEDGQSTPIPGATWKFIKWLGVDVYGAKNEGSYFVMPKWRKGLRPGRTHIYVKKLIDREELQALSMEEIRRRAEETLLFDAYREAEKAGDRSKHKQNIEGLENVLCRCPHCGAEFKMEVLERKRIRCMACGFEESSDRSGLLHKTAGPGQEIRYVTDWSNLNREAVREEIESGRLEEIHLSCEIWRLQKETRRFERIGQGEISADRKQILLREAHGQMPEITIPAGSMPTLPFKPGCHIELQQGEEIYRLIPDERRKMMKLVNAVELFGEKKLRGD